MHCTHSCFVTSAAPPPPTHTHAYALPQALLNSSHKYAEAKNHFADYGIKFDGLSYDFGAIMKQKETAVTGLTKGIEGLLKKNKVRGGGGGQGREEGCVWRGGDSRGMGSRTRG